MNAKKTKAAEFPIHYLLLGVLALFVAMSFFNRFFFAPKILLLCLIIFAAVVLGKGPRLYKDWFVFFSFIYLFDSLRGTIYILTCRYELPVHVSYVIEMERFLFGEIPSLVLQKTLLGDGIYTWLEKTLTVVHGTHFIAFLFVGLVIWLRRADQFRSFKSSFYWVTFLGVTVYFLAPTAPPWIASNVLGILPQINHFNTEIYNMSIPDITAGFSTNPVAAMPSLHSAFPILCSLILWRVYRWKSIPIFFYTLAILFTIVYTGDHYIIDILAGALLAGLSFLLGFKVRNTALKARWEKIVPQRTEPLIASFRKNPVFTGALLLTLGITLGMSNKNQFKTKTTEYNYEIAPNYADVMENEDRYRENFLALFYIGNHHLLKGRTQQALRCYERARSVSDDYILTKKAELQIKQIGILAEQQKSAR